MAASATGLDTVPFSAGVHAWASGAAGTMTLAVMTRASLGHSGRPLHAGWGTQAIYAAVLVATVVHLVAAFFPPAVVLLHVAAFAWAAAFLGFAALYGPLFFRSHRG